MLFEPCVIRAQMHLHRVFNYTLLEAHNAVKINTRPLINENRYIIRMYVYIGFRQAVYSTYLCTQY